jgi:hypothetical protein
LITYKGRTEVVDLYPGSKRVVSAEDLANAEAGMEYGFLKNIAKLVNPERPSVAYAVGHGQPTNENTYDLQQNCWQQLPFYYLQPENAGRNSGCH